MGLILKGKGGKKNCLPNFWFWPMGLDIFEREHQKKGALKKKIEGSTLSEA